METILTGINLDKFALDAYGYPIEQIAKELQTNLTKGLNEADAKARLEVKGMNEIKQKESMPIVDLILKQFEDKLIIILLVAAGISFLIAFFFGDEEGFRAYVEPIVIVIILIANALIGVMQELKAEEAILALSHLQPSYAHVIRNGESQIVHSEQLVPGDIVRVSSGDKVPADLRIFDITSNLLQVDEAILTGEARPVTKSTKEMQLKNNLPCMDKLNMLFGTTLIQVGAALGIVVGTGETSVIGSINKEVREAGNEPKKTPLQIKLDQFGDLLSKVIVCICIIIFVVNIPNIFGQMHGGILYGILYYFEVAVSLAVAAIPEGLPIVTGTCLALGARRLAYKNAIVRDLTSVETLGCTTVICSDKTGTLTMNKMTASKLCVLSASEEIKIHDIKGVGLNIQGEISGTEEEKTSIVFKLVGKICALCSDARLFFHSRSQEIKHIGNATEAALLVLAEKIAASDPSFEYEDEYDVSKYYDRETIENEVILKMEFQRERKCMSALVRAKNNSKESKHPILLTKGAAEILLDRCSSVMLNNGKIVEKSPKIEQAIKNELTKFSSQALRCVGFSFKEKGLEPELLECTKENAKDLIKDSNKYIQYESKSTFLGFAGIIDKPRPGVAEAIQICKSAGIKVIMVTGDNLHTAIAISKEIGIIENDDNKRSIEGINFDNLSEEEKAKWLENWGSVFARVTPKHKREIVKILGLQNHITAMTGDGVNDAPALHQANIGIAMGITGTEVAKEASKIILADDNFVTIVKAIEEGRSIYDNIKAFIRYLISTNIGEVVCIFLVSVLGLPDCISSLQILWINLISDGLPALALGFNPPESNIMKRPPRDSKEGIITFTHFFRYCLIGIYLAIATVGMLIYWYMYADTGDGHTLISWDQLSNWNHCPSWDNFQVNNFGKYTFSNPCEYFTIGKDKPATMVLTVLIISEMIVALHSLSDIDSLFTTPPWRNIWLCLAVASSIILHIIIIKVEIFREIFGVTDLTIYEWLLTIAFSIPIFVIEELFKYLRQEIALFGQQDASKKEN